MIAVANAARYLGKTPNDPNNLASYSKGQISGSGETGWGSSNKSIEVLLNYTGLKSNGYLWTSYSTSTADKVSKIRQTLANGGVVIAGGDRKNGPNKLVSCTDKNSGKCVFSYNGHFVAIVGITSDNKLVVAENVLKFSNKAIGVRK